MSDNRITRLSWLALSLMFSLFIAGCTGGSSSSSDSGGSSYTVSGTVSGLGGLVAHAGPSKNKRIKAGVVETYGTVVLQDNGADDYTVSADGTFVFNTPVADSAIYNVTVSDQPEIGQCKVIGGSGIINGANVTGVTVVCSPWVNPTSLSDNLSPDGGDTPQVAMDSTGDAIIVWRQWGDTTYQIYQSTYNGVAWTDPSSVSGEISNDGPDFDYAKVAMDSSGNAIIIWEQFDGANWQVYKSEYRGGVWTGPSDLNDHVSVAGQDSDYASLAMDDDGNAIIAWTQIGQIYKSTYNGTAWTNPADINDHIDPGGGGAQMASVAMSDNGTAIIAWPQNDGTKYQIFKSMYNGVAWTNPADIDDHLGHDEQDADNASVAMDSSGNAVIAWPGYQYPGPIVQIYKSTYNGVAWTDPASIDDHISPSGGNAYDPTVVMDHSGNAIIIWRQEDGPNNQIYKSTYNGVSWTNPADINDHISLDGQDAYRHSVAMDNNGNAIIAWQADNGSGLDGRIYKSEYRYGAWTNPSSTADGISPDGGYADYPPSVAMSDNGTAIITWAEYDSSNEWIFKSYYQQ